MEIAEFTEKEKNKNSVISVFSVVNTLVIDDEYKTTSTRIL